MVTKAAAQTTIPTTALDPKTVDFDLIIAQARRPTPKPVSIFLRHDLFAEIEELDRELDVLDRAIEGRPPKDKADRGVGDATPSSLEAEREELLAKRNPLAQEFNDSRMEFAFRLVERGDRIKAKAAMVADGHKPEDDEENEIFPCYMMAQTCVTVDWPGSKWLAFRDAVGEFPFLPLQQAFQDSGTAGMLMNGPFSPRPSTTPTSNGS